MLIPVKLGKLPEEVLHNFVRERNNSEWTIENFREALLKEIRILEQGLFTHGAYTTDSSLPRQQCLCMLVLRVVTMPDLIEVKNCISTHTPNNC